MDESSDLIYWMSFTNLWKISSLAMPSKKSYILVGLILIYWHSQESQSLEVEPHYKSLLLV